MAYAKGSRALGICDRCGFAFRLNSLRFQQADGRMTALKVCRSCMDIDNEQWQLRTLDLTDNQALRDPRPETDGLEDFASILWGPEVPAEWGSYRNMNWG